MTSDLLTFSTEGPQLGWKNRSGSKEFRTKVIAICGRLGIDPNNLMAIMYIETAGTFRPDKGANAITTGLIQFQDGGAATATGTTVAALKKMTNVQQLDYVEKYLNLSIFKNKNGITKLGDIGNLYTACFLPYSVGKEILAVKGDPKTGAYYSGNWKTLDPHRNGKITTSDMREVATRSLMLGMQNQNE